MFIVEPGDDLDNHLRDTKIWYRNDSSGAAISRVISSVIVNNAFCLGTEVFKINDISRKLDKCVTVLVPMCFRH